MSNLLSASSLLLAILTTLYALFYSSINEFLDIIPKPHKVDNKANHKKGIEIRNTKIFPILFASISLSLIFIPDAIKIFRDSYLFDRNNIEYDTVKMTYITVTVFMICLSISIIMLTCKFFKKLYKLKQ